MFLYGFYFVLFTSEGRGMIKGSWSALRAIAGITLLEATRRKVFTILLLFALALISSIMFFPAVRSTPACA